MTPAPRRPPSVPHALPLLLVAALLCTLPAASAGWSSAGSLSGHTHSVHDVTFLNDTRLISGGYDESAFEWNWTTAGWARGQDLAPGDKVYSLTPSPNGSVLAIGLYNWIGIDEALWVHATDNLSDRVGVDGGAFIRAVSFAPNGTLAATFADSGVDTIRILNTSDWSTVLDLEGHTDVIRSLGWSPDGRWLTSCDEDDVVNIWDTTNWSLHANITVHEAWLDVCEFTPDGELLTADQAGVVKRWSLPNVTELEDLTNASDGAIKDIEFSDDGRLMVAVDDQKQVQIWDVANWTVTERVAISTPQSLWGVSIRPSADLIAVAGQDGKVHLVTFEVDEPPEDETPDNSTSEPDGNGTPPATTERETTTDSELPWPLSPLALGAILLVAAAAAGRRAGSTRAEADAQPPRHERS